MSAWLLSIVGIVCLGILIEIIMPEGEHSKYIKGIFSLIVIFVIMSPLPKLLNTENIEDLDFFDESINIQADEDSFEKLSENFQYSIKNNFKNALAEDGLDIKFDIEFDSTYVYKANSIILYESEEIEASQKELIQQTVLENLGKVDIIWK